MKRINQIFCLLMLVLGLAACEKEYDRPPLTEPGYTGEEANITIAQFREQFKDATRDVPILIEDDLVLKATVISSDESGNIYKTIYLQDETGGIGMLVDQGDVYTSYPVGQVVYVQLKGLCASFYGDLQIGHPNAAATYYRTPWEDFQEHVLKAGWPNEAAISIREVSDISSLNENADAVKSTLVRLTGVHFEEGGQTTYADMVAEDYGTRVLKDVHGNTIDVRNSNYADFGGEMLPVGTGNVVAILGSFNGGWQLLIRDIEDVYGFDGVDPDEGGSDNPGGGGTTETIFEESFATSQGDFEIHDVLLPEGSTYVWKWAEYNGNAYMNASAYVGGANKESKSWLVSPAIDLAGCSSATLAFEHAQRFATNPSEELTLYVAPAGSSIVESAENNDTGVWQKVAISNYSDGSNWTFVSATADLSAFVGQSIQFAFRYVSSTAGAAQWEIRNVAVTGATSNSGSGDSDDTPDIVIP